MSSSALAEPPPPLPPPAPPPPSLTPSEPPPSTSPPPVTRPRQAREREREDREEREERPMGEDGAPAARTGFQIGLRPGVSIPIGSAAKDAKLSDLSSPQFTLNADIGGKIIPNLFIGGYHGIGFGGVAGKTSDVCNKANKSCNSVGFRIGIEAQYHFLPAAKMNPWVGYGIGWEVLSVGDGNNNGNTAISGLEFAHFMGGLDFRLSHVVGIGPFVDLSLGRYGTASVSNGNTTSSNDIADKAVHGWFTLGARILFFP